MEGLPKLKEGGEGRKETPAGRGIECRPPFKVTARNFPLIPSAPYQKY